ncbi:hypothetical protein VTO42DRAFT_7755 [Malbranchea cinnamomea]
MSFRAKWLLRSRPGFIPTTPRAIATRPTLNTLVPRCLYVDWRSDDKNWKGTEKEDHGVNRAKKGDTTDPLTEGIEAGQKEKAETESESAEQGKVKSQATSQKDYSKKTREEEFPEAPRPIIGMNEERGRVSCVSISPTMRLLNSANSLYRCPQQKGADD